MLHSLLYDIFMKARKHLDLSIKEKAVKAYRNGKAVDELSEIFGVSERTLYRWVNRYKRRRTVKPDKDKRGRPQKIGKKEGRRLLRILKKPASKFGFENDLWNTKRLQMVCKREFRIEISHVGIWNFLNRFNQSFKKVQKQYYETNVGEQEEWKKKMVARIKQTVKSHRAILYFEDESNIQLSPVMGKSWGDIGKKIAHKVTGNKGSLSAMSAISGDGRLLFRLFEGGKRFRSDDIIGFLDQMLEHHKRRHLVVVMDKATCHTSKKTQSFIGGKKRLHVFFLPPRSPELNPDEQVWGYLKNHGLKSHRESTVGGLKKLASKKLKTLSNNPKKVQGIFKLCRNSNLYGY